VLGKLLMLFQLSFWVKKYFMPADRANCGSWALYPKVSGSQNVLFLNPKWDSKNR
jgi:hypothetical protein